MNGIARMGVSINGVMALLLMYARQTHMPLNLVLLAQTEAALQRGIHALQSFCIKK